MLVFASLCSRLGSIEKMRRKKSGMILSVYDATETRDVRGKKKDKG